MLDSVPIRVNRARRAIDETLSETASELGKAIGRTSKELRTAGELVVAQTKRSARRVARHAKEVAGDFVDGTARAAKKVEERILRKRGDRVLKGFPRPLQLDDYSCGVQCTMAILEYFGHERLERELRRELHTTKREGTDRAAIVEVLQAHGCRCSTFDKGRRDTLARAIRSKAPVLVEVDGNHWAVVYGLGPEHVYVADPSVVRSRRVVLDWETFRQRWDRAGVVAKGQARRPRRGR